MKTLRAFWHWVDNEKPSVQLYATKAGETLSELAHEALLKAEAFVAVRAGADSVELDHDDRVSDEEVRAMWPAIRDLSLRLLEAFEKMHAQVPEDYLGKRYPTRKPMPGVVEHGSQAFAGVDSGRYESMLTDLTVMNRSIYDLVEERLENDRVQRQLAANQFANTQLANMPATRVAMAPVAVEGQCRSDYDSVQRLLTIFTTVTVRELDSFRGLSPKTIHLRGMPCDYAPHVLHYMGSWIWPMVADGAHVVTREDPRALEWNRLDWFGR